MACGHSKVTAFKLFNGCNVESAICIIFPTTLLAPNNPDGTCYHWLRWWTIWYCASIDETQLQAKHPITHKLMYCFKIFLVSFKNISREMLLIICPHLLAMFHAGTSTFHVGLGPEDPHVPTSLHVVNVTIRF